MLKHRLQKNDLAQEKVYEKINYKAHNNA
jgi:hypothetical protein